MCGITGVYNYKSGEPVNEALLQNMCDVIAHRGPDGDGIYRDEEAGLGLGHRRLSIIDLETGDQPMCNSSGTIYITFNGEIYNFPELKEELLKEGVRFRTSSDTEVIIYLYEKEGVSGFSKLNGIFSLAIYDKTRRELVLARDHFGVKPMYYYLDDERLLFGSEMKSIISYPGFKKELDLESLSTFLTLRYNPSPQTLIKGIKKLPPAHYLKISSEGMTEFGSYWDYKPSTNFKITENEAIEEYQKLLENAVKRQMLSDVPVGLLLSGGVDSAVIGHLMQRCSSDTIKTFSIGFEGKGDYNELTDAKETADYIGSNHYDMEITGKEYLDFFFDSFYYTEEPIAITSIPALYYVSKLAASHGKVVLSGQGADEPLAGYKRYYGEKKLDSIRKIINLLPASFINSIFPRNERLNRALYASNFSDKLERFIAIYTIIQPKDKKRLLKNDMYVDSDTINQNLFRELFNNSSRLHDSLSQMLYIDTRSSLSDKLLLLGDKMSMANGLELRVPFLDVELVKFLESLPSNLKLKGNNHKYIHKKAVSKWLPESIISRKKRGFETPMDNWLQNDMGNKLKEILNDESSASSNYFELDYINRIINLHMTKKGNFERQLFSLLSFEVWHRRFFSKDVLN